MLLHNIIIEETLFVREIAHVQYESPVDESYVEEDILSYVISSNAMKIMIHVYKVSHAK